MCSRVEEHIESDSVTVFASSRAQQTIKLPPLTLIHKPNAHYVCRQGEIAGIRPHLAHILTHVFEK